MKRILGFLFIVALLGNAILGCGRPQSKDDEGEADIPVQVATVSLGNVVQSLTYNGDINAEFEVKVFSKIPDRIEKFYVDEGNYVSKGDSIAKIYAATIEQAVRQAEAGLLAATAQASNLKMEYDRAQRLFKENAMSKQQYDAVETQYEAVKAQLQQAEAMFETAKSQLKDATVQAPINGIIGKRYFEAGDMAAPSMPLVSIVQMKRVKVTFNATEADLGKLALGQKANVTVKSYPNRSFEGKVTKISPILDPLTRMAMVEVIINNPQKLLKPGMYSRVEVTTGIIENVIVVPRYATIENTTLEKIDGEDRVSKNYYVFIVDSSKAHQKKLDVIYVNHKRLAINSGVKIGDKLVITGQNNLRDGSTVTVIQEGDEL